jgi:xylulokinase
MADARDSFGPGFAPTDPIPVIGGGSRSDLVLQILADTLGLPVGRAEAGAGGAALGAGLLAEAGLDGWTPGDLGVVPALSRVFEPRPAPALQARRARFRSLYAAVGKGI